MINVLDISILLSMSIVSISIWHWDNYMIGVQIRRNILLLFYLAWKHDPICFWDFFNEITVLEKVIWNCGWWVISVIREFFLYVLSVDTASICKCIGQKAWCGVVTLTIFCSSDSECLCIATSIRIVLLLN